MISLFFKSFKMLISDKIIFFSALIPILIGGAIFYFIGDLLISDFYEYLKGYLTNYFGESFWTGFFGSILYFLLGVLIILLINWFYVMFVSIIAAPFNIIISSRIEKRMKNEEQFSFTKEFGNLKLSFLGSIFDEIKKVLLVLFLIILSFILSFIPVLNIIAWVLNAYILTYEFLDFSYSRHEYKYSQIIQNYKSHVFRYGIGGGIFLFIITLPVVSIIVPSLATSFFTLLYIDGQQNINKIT